MFPALRPIASALNVLAGAIVLVSIAAPVHAQNEVAKIFDPIGAVGTTFGDLFGDAVDIKDDRIIVGAVWDNITVGLANRTRAGSASIFKRSSGVWSWEATLVVPTPTDRPNTDDFFGNGVAIDGIWAIVGCPGDDDPIPPAISGAGTGSAFVFQFNGSTWVPHVELHASVLKTNESFGSAVAMDGDLAVIGARYGGTASSPGVDQGAAYVFRRSGTLWTQEARLLAIDGAPFDAFGEVVAIDRTSIHGDVIIVGAPFHDAGGPITNNRGAAYVFRFNGSAWVQEAKLSPADLAVNDQFGHSVDVSGDAIVVGSHLDEQSPSAPNSGSAYVFRFNGSTWAQEAKLLPISPIGNENFGSSVGIDGSAIVVGARSDAFNAGTVSAYQFDGMNWIFIEQLTASDGDDDDLLGTSLAIDGSQFVAGAPGALGNVFGTGAAYVFGVPPAPCPPLTLTVPPDMTIECDALHPENQLPPHTGTATATGLNAQVSFEDECVIDDDPFALGVVGCLTCPKVIHRTWTATDDCSHTASQTQIITVTDMTDPAFIYVPADVGPLPLTEEQSAAGSPETGGFATAHDTCSSVVVGSSDVTVTLPGGDNQITRTWSATDTCGNSTSAAQVITIMTTPPCPPLILTAPASLAIDCGQSALPSNTGSASVSGLNPHVEYSDECLADDDPETPGVIECQVCPKVISRTWTATDDCDGFASDVQIITVTDTTAPHFTYVPANVGPVSLSEEQSAPGSLETGGFATAADDCTDVVVSSSDVVVILPNTNKQITRTWTATDSCGNSVAAAPQVITIIIVPPDCNGQTIEVNGAVTVNFNPVLTGGVPVYSGDPDLAPFVTYIYNPAQPAQTWRVVFNLAHDKLLIAAGATITVSPVPATGNNQAAPGIEIRSLCDLEIQPGGSVNVSSTNRTSGGVLIDVGGEIVINGSVISQTGGTNNGPGPITIASAHGNITTGTSSLITTRGIASANISIFNGCESGGAGGGDIAINGLVDVSYRSGNAVASIVAFDGRIAIDGNTLQGIEAGTSRRITTGVTVRNTANPQPGRINIQAEGDISVVGNAVLDWRYPNIGAVGVKTGSSGPVGGAIDVRSINGSIFASDRAFDDANRYNTTATIDLRAAVFIVLSATPGRTNSVKAGADPLAMAVVSSQAGRDGTGGTNTLLAFFGGSIGPKAEVLGDHAEPNNGANGHNMLNALISADPAARIAPARTNAAPAMVTPLFNSCADLGVSFP